MLAGPLLFMGCQNVERRELAVQVQDIVPEAVSISDNGLKTGKTSPNELVSYAETLVGKPYCYASSDLATGFDCSGFVTWVFKRFNISVPRSSVDFTDVGREVSTEEARRGDIILFTGTDSTIRIVGHMGIITSNDNEMIRFIHSSSGKAKGVVITPLENYYRSRFVKINRVFPEHHFKSL